MDSINVNSYSGQPPVISSFLGINSEPGVNDIFMGSSNSVLGANILASDLMLGGMPRSNAAKSAAGDDPYSFNYQATSTASAPPVKQSGFVNEGFTSRFKWRPTSIDDFGEVRCKATNEIGTTECIYELKLGGELTDHSALLKLTAKKLISLSLSSLNPQGVPNPPTDCTHTLKNSSAIISCQVGFHQVSGQSCLPRERERDLVGSLWCVV